MSLYAISDVINENEHALAMLRNHSAIRRTATCWGGRAMTEVAQGRVYRRGNAIRMFRCPDHQSSMISRNADSIWANTQLPYTDLILLAYLWAYMTPVEVMIDQLGLGNDAIINWCNLFCESCSTWLLNNFVQIGGVGHVVQIDETLIEHLTE